MRLILSGYYGFGNLGDEALLAGVLGALHARGHECVVLSGDPAATTALHGVPAVHRTRGLLAGLLRADALVSGGGGLLQDGTSGRSLSYYLGVMRLARWLRRPVAVYAQSLGPLSEAGTARVGQALRGVPVFVRDQPSLTLAAAMGVRAALVADPALLLPAPAAASAERRGPVVLVPRGGQEGLNRSLATLARGLMAAGVDVLAVSMHPIEDDAPVNALVAAAPGVQARAVPTPAAALELFAAAGYVVSVRLHGCVLAAVAGTGFAGLSYDPKVAGFLEQARAPVFGEPVDDGALLALATARPAPDAAAFARLLALAGSGVNALLTALSGGPGAAVPTAASEHE